MPRPLRLEYAGAIYHLTSRGDRREKVFADTQDREQFLELLGRACLKMGWEVHAYCLLPDHWHAVIETPQPNLADGMRWLLGIYTQSFNRRHGLSGRVFRGRYKSHVIDHDRGYLAQACNYVHLNPQRAGLLKRQAPLESYPWSSYPSYLRPALRRPWQRVDRLLGEQDLEGDTAKERREFARQMEALGPLQSAAEYRPLRRGWKLGAKDFVNRLAEKLTAPNTRAENRLAREREVDELLAERLVKECLRAVGWTKSDLQSSPKGDPVKVEIARQVRDQTPMTRQWIADRLRMGTGGYLSNLLGSAALKL